MQNVCIHALEDTGFGMDAMFFNCRGHFLDLYAGRLLYRGESHLR